MWHSWQQALDNLRSSDESDMMCMRELACMACYYSTVTVALWDIIALAVSSGQALGLNSPMLRHQNKLSRKFMCNLQLHGPATAQRNLGREEKYIHHGLK